MDRQADGWTSYCFIDPALHTVWAKMPLRQSKHKQVSTVAEKPHDTIRDTIRTAREGERSLRETDHHVNEGGEAPESIDLVFHDDEYWRQQVTHSLHVPCAWTSKLVTVSNTDIAVHNRKVATLLRELTCRMGSHSVTCYSPENWEVTFLPVLQQSLYLTQQLQKDLKLIHLVFG